MTFIKNNSTSIIGAILIVFFTYTAGASVSESVSTVTEGSVIVWSDQGSSGYPVYLSEFIDGKWLETIQVTDNQNLNLVPCVTKDDTGVIWVAWTVFNGGNSELYFKRYVNGEWSDEQKVDTGLTENTAPTIIIDNKQTLWLAWSSNDGVGDDIFFARWDGSHFEPAERITDTATPDVLPILGVTKSGKVWVQWQSFNDDTYITNVSEWDGDEWTAPLTTVKRVKLQLEGNDSNMEFLESNLPDMVNDYKKSTIHIPGNEIQSLPLKFFELNED